MTSKTSMITRFAPSPTGLLHIGGARTALFNWLYCKHNNGKMRLRIEDTDTKRSTKQAIDAIMDGLQWLGLEWDDEVVFQHSRAARHKEIAELLVKSGQAYYCYASAEELHSMREQAIAENRSTRYNGMWRDKTPEQAILESRQPTIRLKIPQDGYTIIQDQVQGEVKIPNADLEDFIILRSDGSPTYMLAVVVDDYDMGVTNIIRGDDHLTNSAKQILIYQALNWPIPEMAHIPLIHGADGAKLSKRHGALGIESYKEMGYLPAALCNYLAKLGWSHGNDEIMSKEQMIEWFDIKDVNKAPSRLDFKKLESINAHYIKNSDNLELYNRCMDLINSLESFAVLKAELTTEHQASFLKAIEFLKQRSKTLLELIESANFLFNAPINISDQKTLETLQKTQAEIIEDLAAKLQEVDVWEKEPIEKTVRNWLETSNLKFSDVAPAVRALLTGNVNAAGIFDLLASLKQAEAINRLSRINKL